METIISYIENLFRNYPDTPETKKIKDDLLGTMEDKYNELKAEGKSENEAIGIVISEFGNIEEIAAELDIEPKVSLKKEEEDRSHTRPEYKLSLEEAKDYIASQMKFGKRIALAVMLCILSVVPACIMDALKDMGVEIKAADEISALALFLFVAVAVGIFITQGIANSKYDEMKKGKIVLDYGTKQYVIQQLEKYHSEYGRQIAYGVVFCILSVVPEIILEAFFKDSSYVWVSNGNIGGIFLFFFVAAGVFCFIHAGIKKGAYELLLGKGEYSREKRKENRLTGMIASIYWTLVTVAYLVWSFISGQWGVSWCIWPIAGILFGGIAAVINQVSEAKK